MYILTDSLLLDDINYRHTFFLWQCHYFMEALAYPYPSSSICYGHCVYFKTLVAAIHENKRSMADSRKFEGYLYMREDIITLLF